MENLDPKEPLKVFEVNPDEQGRLQKMILANVTYIIQNGSVLMMTHTKTNSVTDSMFIGVGGKYAMKSFLGYESEKIPTKDMMSSVMTGKIQMEDSLNGTCREINEETGLDVQPDQLRAIGFSHIKRCNEKVNEIWNIVSYIVDDYKGEIDIEKMNRESKEGIFTLINLGSIDKVKMFPADSIIFNNRNNGNDIYVEAIYDDVGGGELRYVLNNGKNDGVYSSKYILIPDLTRPTDYIGEELEVEADSFKDCDMFQHFVRNGNDIDKFVENAELKTISYLPGIKSNIRQFRYPECSELVRINKVSSNEDIER